MWQRRQSRRYRTCAQPPAPVMPAQGAGGVWLAQHVSHAAALHVLHGQHDQVVLFDGQQSRVESWQAWRSTRQSTTQMCITARPAGKVTGCCRQAGADCMQREAPRPGPATGQVCPAQALTSTEMPYSGMMRGWVQLRSMAASFHTRLGSTLPAASYTCAEIAADWQPYQLLQMAGVRARQGRGAATAHAPHTQTPR